MQSAAAMKATILIPLLVAALVPACSKAPSKEDRVNAVCDKMYKEDTAECAGDADCVETAKAKLDSCKSLAKTVGEADKPHKSLEDQVADEKKKCDGGDQDGCAMYGGALMLGKGTTKDEAKGVAMVKKACEANNAQGCELYGRAYDKGIGVTADSAQYATLMEKACSLGSPGGCRSHAMSFDHADPKRIPLLQKACDGDDGIGCMGLGAAYLNGGQGTDKDLAKAKTYLQKACDLLDDPEVCDKAREL